MLWWGLKTKLPPAYMVIPFFGAAAALFPVRLLQMFLRFFADTALTASALYPQAFYSAYSAHFFNSFVIAALIEEGCKAGIFILLSRFMQYYYAKRGTAVQPYHSLLAAFFFGFLFSGFENVSYGIRYPQFQLFRIATASVLHGTLGCFYFKIQQAKTQRAIAGFFLAALALHGCYNFLAGLGGWFMLPALAVIGLAVMTAIGCFFSKK